MKKKVMSYSKEVSKKLNDLLEKNYDAEKGFKEAAENVDNNELKNFFEKKAKQRYDFGHEIKSEIRNFGEKPDKGSSVAADAHRSWMNLKAKFQDSEEAVLEEAVRGEKAAVKEYEDVIKDPTLPASTTNILMRHKNAIETSLEEVEILEEQF